MEMDEMYDDDTDESTGGVDVCPSCGTLLDGIEEPTVGCNDPMGCGAYLSDDEEEYEEDEDDYGVEELDFDN